MNSTLQLKNVEVNEEAMENKSVEDLYNRHSGMVDLGKIMSTTVEIIGMGSIGSHAMYALACQGFQKFRIWDKRMA